MYGIVFSFVYKVPPAVALIVLVWHHDVTVGVQTLKTLLAFSLLYAYFCAQVYVENHELISERIADLHAKYDWSDVFPGYQPPISKRSFQRSEAIGLAVVWVLLIVFQMLVTLTNRSDVTMPL